MYALRREWLRGAAALGLIGLALAGALAIWISGVLTRPLSQLADAAAKLADGDYAAPLPAAKNDEMNALIRAFSRMSAAIDERETALRTQAEERQALIDALAHEMRTPLTPLSARGSCSNPD
ncbi:MAG: HAMP domain-containing protein [Christensenellales bacterium]